MKSTSARLLYAIFFVSTALSLGGCATAIQVPAVPGDKKVVDFDRSLLADCPELPKAKSGSDTDLKDWAEAVIKVHTECAVNKKKQNREVKKAFNIE